MTGWHRTSRHERGYGGAWDRIRKQVLQRDNDFCQPCLRQGRVTAATEVDHINPRAKQGSDDPGNLQAICGPCHQAKTAAENGRMVKARTTFDRDGWPVWEPR